MGILVLLFAACVFANHFAYVAYYSSSRCRGDPQAVSPVYPGESRYCARTGGDICLDALRGFTESSSFRLDCESGLYADGGSTVDFTDEDGNTQSFQYNDCNESDLFDGCSFEFIQGTGGVSIGSGDTVPTGNPDFVGFVNFFSDSNCGSNSVKFRAPIYEDEAQYCYDSTATTCSGAVRGFTLETDDVNRACQTNDIKFQDLCVFQETDSGVTSDVEFGTCYTSDTFLGCNVEFSSTNGLSGDCNGNPGQPRSSNGDSSDASL